MSDKWRKNDEWRKDRASERQMEKLRFFGCTWDKGITKGQASDAIDECIKRFPEAEARYQKQKLNRQKAKDRYIEKWAVEHLQLGGGIFGGVIPSSVLERLQKAIDELDATQPGWSEEEKQADAMLLKAISKVPE
jgi:hypothetical protein